MNSDYLAVRVAYRLIDGEVSDAEYHCGAMEVLAVAQYRVVHRSGRQPCAYGTRSLQIGHIGGNAFVVKKDCRGCAGHRLYGVHDIAASIE